MRRLLVTAFAALLVGTAFAQVDTSRTANRNILQPKSTRANDNFLLQLGYTRWTGKPDSINTKGFSRSFNLYLMLDFPFKTNPHLSVAIGPGIATGNIYFDKMSVNIKDVMQSVRFNDLSDTSHFKKYKLATAYLEAPVELRYRFNAEDDRKSVKLALGVKVGTLVNAHVKGVDLEDKNNNSITPYTLKENSKRFFNKTRLSGMFRAGYGNFTVFASYAITPVFKEGVGPTVRPFTIGLSLSGL